MDNSTTRLPPGHSPTWPWICSIRSRKISFVHKRRTRRAWLVVSSPDVTDRLGIVIQNGIIEMI
ncbi:hypothetical protein P692DRAFT_20824343 [Suillus brevipes Sb2]|nr:hypothetical protein P692DRAFT_20824343 [Suillus brevipes Sb2]